MSSAIRLLGLAAEEEEEEEKEEELVVDDDEEEVMEAGLGSCGDGDRFTPPGRGTESTCSPHTTKLYTCIVLVKPTLHYESPDCRAAVF